MRLLKDVTATVGRIVEELRQYVDKYSDFCVRFYDGDPAYVQGINEATADGKKVLVLEANSNEGKALTIKSLIESLEGYDDATGVLISWSGIRNFDLKNGVVFQFEEDEVDIWFFAGDDIRLFSGMQICADLERFTEEYADARVVLYGEDDETYFVTSAEWDDWIIHIDVSVESDESLTVADLKEELSCYGTESGCEFRIFDEDDDFVESRTLKRLSDGNIFYVVEYDGQTVIACQLGEIVFDEYNDSVYSDDED